MNGIKKIRGIRLLALLSLISYTAYSQENFIPGYIIKSGNDRINGFIDYRNWDNNPEFVRFKSDADGDPLSYKPTEVIEFGVENEIYVSGIVKIEVTSLETQKLIYDPKLNIEVDTVFLQTLFKGKKELYYYKNIDNRENFYIRQGSEIELLIYKQYLKEQLNLLDNKYNQSVIENKTYLGQLALYLNDCPGIQKKLNTSQYKQNSLSSLFEYYYDCSPSDISFSREAEKISVEFGVLLGPSVTSLKFISDSRWVNYLDEADFDLSTNLSGGIFFDLILPRNQGKWSINYELFYSSHNNSGIYEDDFNNATITSTLAYSYLSLKMLVRYKYLLGPVSLYVNGGGSAGFAISEINLKESNFYNAGRIEEDLALLYSRKRELSFIAGTGIKYKQYSFEIRIEKGDGMSAHPSVSSNTTKYYFLFGYKF